MTSIHCLLNASLKHVKECAQITQRITYTPRCPLLLNSCSTVDFRAILRISCRRYACHRATPSTDHKSQFLIKQCSNPAGRNRRSGTYYHVTQCLEMRRSLTLPQNRVGKRRHDCARTRSNATFQLSTQCGTSNSRNSTQACHFETAG